MAATNWLHHKADGTFKKSKRGKYNARGSFVGEQWFASKAEAGRYHQLLELQARGEIAELECQPSWKCYVAGLLVCEYRADFRYRARPGKLGSRIVVEDVKGMLTKEYGIKKKLMKALHPGVDIVELKVPKTTADVQRWRYLTGDRIKEIPNGAVDPRPAEGTGD